MQTLGQLKDDSIDRWDLTLDLMRVSQAYIYTTELLR